MAKKLKIMGIHGLGDHRESDWAARWQQAITASFPKLDLELEFVFITYDDIFEGTKISLAESLRALWKLTKSGMSMIGRRERGVVSEISDRVKWTAGYVVAWVEDEGFKSKSRKLILDALAEHKPDVILAHSLGSLITYNAFTHADARKDEIAPILARATYVTFGSQIGNPFVIRNLTNGRIQPINLSFWHHLYNPHDDVFTAPIRMNDMANFSQTETAFDLPGVGDHAAEGYLGHESAIENVWRPIGAGAVDGGRSFIPPPGAPRAVGAAGKRQKALLVGINDYADPAQRLEGCINDVFTISAALQDCGFAPESIRTCLDSRATAQGIFDRMKWLMDSAAPGDELIFYYSGHGARVPEYGEDFEPDHYVETLVPWDFDWSPETYISDDQIYGLYSQLPYDCRLIMIFDCCHSGGIHRDGGRKPRGIVPPDDIRHRELKWDSKTEMWVSRDFKRINEDFTQSKEVAQDFFGRSGAAQRIGRAAMLRGLSTSQYQRLKKKDELLARGPYLPVIIEACGEDELSYEYRHGATSHGAFTFSLANILRRQKSITFEDLVELTTAQLADLQYPQRPRILGPSAIVDQKVPWVGAKA
jgi:hypothetical protein